MALAPGTRLGPYEITTQIGVGGMGEVYRATDTNLKRQVAIKVLPASVTGDAERLARFQREAEVLAALNHPNIAGIYGLEKSDGVTALVMELVEGDDLSKRIARGAIPLDEALPIAKQIAEAVEAAHEQGIIHRDLKPGNIKVRPDGTVKVLDFGLAKAMDSGLGTGDPGPGDRGLVRASQAATITTPALRTSVGVILGTAAYMSPEQARGKAVDRRADVWALGAVLFEMLTGQRAFGGEDVAETLANVINKEPAWQALPPALPPHIRQTLRVCLRKSLRERVPDVGAVRLALEGAFENSASRELRDEAAARPRWQRALPYAVGAAVASIVGSLAAWSLWSSPPLRPVSRFDDDIPVGQVLRYMNRGVMAVAPDGRHVVYNTNEGLYLRPMDALEARLIPGSEANLANPFFSPDGQSVGYWDAASSRLIRIGIGGGTPVAIGPAASPASATWAADGTVFFSQAAKGIFRVSANGGTPELVIRLNAGEEADSPQLLPDGDSVLFSVTTAIGPTRWDQADIVAQSIRTGTRTLVLRGGSDARYLRTGHLVYALGSALFAVAFDPDRLVVSGGAVAVAEGVTRASIGNLGQANSSTANYGVSDDGTLVYVAGGGSAPRRSLVWVDRQGREELLVSPSRPYVYPRISPDGERVAVDIRDQQNDIWIWDLRRETLTRLSVNPELDMYPTWTPDGRRVLFSTSTGDGGADVSWQTADGTGAAERVTNAGPIVHVPHAVSPEGRRVVVRVGADPPYDLAVLRFADGNRMDPLVRTSFSELNAEVSPDGRWLAYESDASGQNEVYVRPFPNVDAGRWQISRGGGTRPAWARSGGELFYLSTGKGSAALMSVPVERQATWTSGTPTKLFEGPYFYTDTFVTGRGRTYDVSPDGRRFLMLKDAAGVDDVPASRLVVVQNWTEELKRLVPVD